METEECWPRDIGFGCRGSSSPPHQLFTMLYESTDMPLASFWFWLHCNQRPLVHDKAQHFSSQERKALSFFCTLSFNTSFSFHTFSFLIETAVKGWTLSNAVLLATGEKTWMAFPLSSANYWKERQVQSIVLTLLLLQLIIEIQIKEGAGSVLKTISSSIGNEGKCKRNWVFPNLVISC